MPAWDPAADRLLEHELAVARDMITTWHIARVDCLLECGREPIRALGGHPGLLRDGFRRRRGATFPDGQVPQPKRAAMSTS